MSRQLVVGSAVLSLATIGGIFWLAVRAAVPRLVYTGQGFGAMVPASAANRAALAPPPDPLHAAVDAFNAGRFTEAETKAAEAVRAGSTRPDALVPVTRARILMAYSAARRREYPLARERFAAAVAGTKAGLAAPAQGGPISREALRSAESDAAYQHAVCTLAMGNRKGGETELRCVIRNYPESAEVHGAVRRIARLHGGDVPRDVQALQRRARAISLAADRARRRSGSMCGPECLAELLHREGKPADLALLAREAATSHEGTTLLALARTAGRHGIPLKGMQLTDADFRKQALPLLALVAPGHIVVVDKIDRACVTVWDPAANGPGRPADKDIVWPQWRRMWRGVALVRAGAAVPAGLQDDVTGMAMSPPTRRPAPPLPSS
jgi:hypothetical protein